LSGKNEIKKAFCKTLAEIAEKEKKKAIQNGEYTDAIFAGFVEGFFKQAERSFD
jgi:hypothetical protein